MRTTSRLAPLCAATVIALALGAPRARAQDATGDTATGIAVFEDGKKLAAAGDWAGACPKFAEAARLYHTAAIFLNLGDCYEHVGKVASAWASWKEAEIMARNAGDTTREEVAAKRGQALAPTLPKFAIVVPPATRIPGLEVRRDGVVVGEGQYGSALPADAGQHTVEATAPGHKTWSTVVRIETNGSSASVEVPALDVLAAPAAVGAGRGPFWSTQRALGVAIGGVGLIGIVVGSAFTASMISKNNASMAYCPSDPTKCYAPGVDLRNQAFDAAHVATGTWIAGALIMSAGLAVFLSAPRRAQENGDAPTPHAKVLPVVAPGLAGLTVQGAW
jgi:hypothetical protein